MLIFMKIIGEKTNEWHPELWEAYGISREDAKIIIHEYEERFNDSTAT